VVTGTGGLGLECALALAGAGARVIIAGRNADKGQAAVAQVQARFPAASVRFASLDLSSLESVAEFGRRLRGSFASVDLLINNAAIMAPPQRLLSVDGLELQFATNYLGHFALTAHLLPLLRRGRDPRVVSVSSKAASAGAIRFDDLQHERGYRPMKAYGQSKLACLMFALELQRRSDAAGWGIRSIGAHPGITRTELIPNSAPRLSAAGLARRALWFLFQPPGQGALPSLFAATAKQAEAGGYYGPDRLAETRGHPAEAEVPAAALERHDAERLWHVSEHLAGVRYAS